MRHLTTNTIIVLLLTMMAGCGINDAYQEQPADSVPVYIRVDAADTGERLTNGKITIADTLASSNGLFDQEVPKADRDVAISASADGYKSKQDTVNTANPVHKVFVLEKIVTTEPQPPTARYSFSTDSLTAFFDASESTDPDGDPSDLSYDWEFGDGNTGSGVTPEHTYKESGSYDVTLTVTDADDLTSKATHTVAVGMENQKPNANFEKDKQDGFTVTFSNLSSDPDGDELSYSWQFGDGKASEEEHPSHTYESAGDYDVTLTATDSHGASDAVTKTITVSQPEDPGTVAVKSKSCSDAGSNTGTVTVTIENGATEVVLKQNGDVIDSKSGLDPVDNQEVTFSDIATGSYEITATKNNQSVTIGVEIAECEPANQKPEADFKVKAKDGLTVTFENLSSDPDGDALSYTWEFGDGGESTAEHPTHIYDSGGDYDVTLTVTDPDGASATITKTITVEKKNQAPEARLTDENKGLTIAYDASGSSDPDGEIVEYRWDWTNDGIIDSVTTTPYVEHTFEDEGDFHTRVVVVDDDGATDEATTRVCPKVILSDEYKHKVTFGGDEKIWVSDHRDRPYDTLLDYGEVRPILTDKDPYGKVKIKVKFKLDSDEVDTEHFALKIYFKEDKSDAFYTPIYPDQAGKDGWVTATKEVDASHFDGHAKDLAGVMVVHGDKLDDSKPAGEDDVYFSKHDTSGTVWFCWRVLL